jgi:hypothetical protein
MKSTLTLCLTVAAIFATTIQLRADDKQTPKPKPTRKPNPAFRPLKDDASLPRVLLIGDSISIGYTVPVQTLLKGKANVHRAPTNCGPTTRGLEQLDSWLGDGKWNVIHFNWGLHDLKYMGTKGENLADPKAADSRPQVPIDQYEKNMRKLVTRLKKTGAKLIWCSTTPVPDGTKGRVVGDSAKYNAVAAKVMQENGVAINDLFAFSKPQLKKIQRPANVHFSPEGSKTLAKEVAAKIEASLSE